MKNKNFVFYSVIIAFVVLFLASAIIFKVYNVEILPSQFYGALIGVFITAIVTAFLLRGQTEGDEKREKSVKVFEEKLLIYKDFLAKLHEVVKEEKISDENVKELIFQISYVAMHTEPNKVNEILKLLGTTIAEIDNNEDGYEKLAKNILDIMLVLQKSLYLEKLGKETDKINTEMFNGLITNLETTANDQAITQPLNIKVIDVLGNSNFLNDKLINRDKKTLRFKIQNQQNLDFELVVTATGKGYVAIRKLAERKNDNDPKYIEMFSKVGFVDNKHWLGVKYFKNYGTQNEKELANKIKEDIETFIKNLKQ
jgi:energy-coupling factor transporter transmembrane protein EcfT